MPADNDFAQRLAGEARSCSFDLLCTLLDSVDRPALIVDHDTRTIAWANAEVQRVFGYPLEELVGSSTRRLHVDAASFSDFGERSRCVVEADTPFQERFWMQRRDGTVFASEHLVTPVRDVAGRRLAVSLVTDISAPVVGRLGERLRRLTGREHQVFQLMIAGLTANESAARLNLSPRTVEVHRGNVLKKLDVSSVTRLLADLLAASVVERAHL